MFIFFQNQWFNQSHNACVNYANRNASKVCTSPCDCQYVSWSICVCVLVLCAYLFSVLCAAGDSDEQVSERLCGSCVRSCGNSCKQHHICLFVCLCVCLFAMMFHMGRVVAHAWFTIVLCALYTWHLVREILNFLYFCSCNGLTENLIRQKFNLSLSAHGSV